MPELPEVETTLRGLRRVIEGEIIQHAVVRCQQLRWPIVDHFSACVRQQRVQSLTRRGKYMMMALDTGWLILHLGMSGHWRFLTKAPPPARHDHVDLVLGQGLLRYTDPRRFGAIIWTNCPPDQHALLNRLGAEPLTAEFNADYLLQRATGRRCAVKSFIMDNHHVVGVGNIYATEALFLAGIHPRMPAGLLSLGQAARLVDVIKTVLTDAIEQGGTTLNDFINPEGQAGYFSQKLHAYGRQGSPCTGCGQSLEACQLGQRRSVFCPQCQPETGDMP